VPGVHRLQGACEVSAWLMPAGVTVVGRDGQPISIDGLCAIARTPAFRRCEACLVAIVHHCDGVAVPAAVRQEGIVEGDELSGALVVELAVPVFDAGASRACVELLNVVVVLDVLWTACVQRPMGCNEAVQGRVVSPDD